MTTKSKNDLAFAQAAAFAFVQVSREFKKNAARESFASNLLQFALSTPSGLSAMKRVDGRINKILQVRREVKATNSERFDLTVNTNIGLVVLEVKVGAPFDESQLKRYAATKGVDVVAFVAPEKQAKEAKEWLAKRKRQTKIISVSWAEVCQGGKSIDGPLWSAIERVATTLPSPSLPLDFPSKFWKDTELSRRFSTDLALAFAGLQEFNKGITTRGSLTVSTHEGNQDLWVCRQRNRGSQRSKTHGLQRYTILEFDPRWDTGPLYISHGNLFYGTNDPKELSRIAAELEAGGQPTETVNSRRTGSEYKAFTRALWSMMFAIQSGLRGVEPDLAIEAGISETGLWLGRKGCTCIVEYCLNLHNKGKMPLAYRVDTKTGTLAGTLAGKSSVLALIDEALVKLQQCKNTHG